MRNLIIILLVFSLYGCTEKKISNESEKKDYKAYALNPDYGKVGTRFINLILTDSLHIIVPSSSPNQYYDSFIYKDSLFFGIHGSNKIDVYNLLSERYVKTITLEKFKMNGEISNVFVQSLDSIFVTTYSRSKIYHFNYTGKIIKTHKPGILSLDITNKRIPKDVVNYRIPLYMTYQKPFIYRGLMYITIEPMGGSSQMGFNKTERIGIFDLRKSEWKKAICKPEGLISIEGTFFNKDLMNPYFVVANKRIYVTYPMDHWVYVYNLEGKLINKKLISASIIKKMPRPLESKEMNIRQKKWNYRIQTPFYGPLFYHDKARIFTRVFYESQDLFESVGKLNSGKKRTGYILLFDENLNKINERKFLNARLGMSYITPLSSCILVGHSNFYCNNENEFTQKYIYKFSGKIDIK